MARLIDDVLAFSREARSEMSTSDIDMTGLVQATLNGLAPTGGWARKHGKRRPRAALSVIARPVPHGPSPAMAGLGPAIHVFVSRT